MHTKYKSNCKTKVKEQLRQSGLEYTPEQIDAIIQALYTLAEVEYEIISSETKDNWNESRHLFTRINGRAKRGGLQPSRPGETSADVLPAKGARGDRPLQRWQVRQIFSAARVPAISQGDKTKKFKALSVWGMIGSPEMPRRHSRWS